MRIAISETYTGYVLSRTLEPGEHEVPEGVGRYLIANFSGPPFYVREPIQEEEEVEVKPFFSMETKPHIPDEIKPKPKTTARKRTVRSKVKP